MKRHFSQLTAYSLQLTLYCLLLFSSPSWALNYFVSEADGSDAYTGLTLDRAWATVEKAVETGGLAAGDTVWVRRTTTETPSASTIACAYDGTAASPIRIIGCPRTALAIASSDYTNGSNQVTIDDANMDREKHQTRWLTAPDGRNYMITRVVDSNDIYIDREYVGTTVSNAGPCTIVADEDYATFAAIDDSAWVIKVADWIADADDMPSVDFGTNSYYLQISSDLYHQFKNMEFKRGVDGTYGSVAVLTASDTLFKNCLISQIYNTNAMYLYYTVLDSCTIEGDSASETSQRLVVLITGNTLQNVAIYNSGDSGLVIKGGWNYLENVNIGVEQSNDDDDISLEIGSLFGRDVKLNGVNGTADFPANYTNKRSVSIENYQKILGQNITFTPQGTLTKVAADGTDEPSQRAGGSASVLEIAYTASGTDVKNPLAVWTPEIFTHEFTMPAEAKGYSYYVQAMEALSSGELWITVEYISGYDDTTEYYVTTTTFTSAVAVRADEDDWTQSIGTGTACITPAVASSRVRIKMYCSFQDAANKIYIDPKVSIF